VGTVFACSIFAAVCGSSPVTAATIGAMSVPEMIRQGYDRRLALGVTAAGGTLGILIPPSIPMIIYGVITETSVGDLFIAGVLPGLGMAVLLSLTVMLMVWRDPKIAPRISTAIAERERWTSLRSVVPVIILSVFVLGSIYAGFATPTEAGAVGALGAIAIAGAVGALTVPAMGRMLGNTVRTTAMFILLIVAGLFTSFVLARLGVPQGMAKILVELPVPPWAILAAINLVLVVLGMFMDPMSILVIMVPVLFPGVTALGYDPVWFGIMLTINIEIAAISPPVGFNLFVLKATIPKTEMSDIIRGAAVFMVPLALGIGLLITFPEIALVLVQMTK
jgi:C4-dicarboxylate transporter DctM subunit